MSFLSTEPADSRTVIMARDPMLDILAAADELTDARQHATAYHVWDDQRNKKLRRHTVVLPGLLRQLYESVIPAGTVDSTRTPPASRPPLALEALSTHTVICLSVARWCWELRIEQRDTTEQNIRALVGRGPQLDRDALGQLRADMRRWRSWCAVMTDWERVEKFDDIPCMHCGQVGSLRVNLTLGRGFCTNRERTPDGELVCGATWSHEDDDVPIMVLGEYIRSWRAAQEVA